MEQPAARRRPVLKAALGGVAAVGAVGGAVRLWPGADPETGSRTLTLSGSASDGIGELAVPLDGPMLARRTASGHWETTGLASTAYSMLALTWDVGETAPEAEIRTRADGGWSDWRPVAVLGDGPDAGSDERSTVAGTDLMWIGHSDGVQVRVGPSRPSGLTLVLLDPWVQAGDEAADELDVPLARAADESLAQAGRVPRPPQRGRRQWGANERWRDGQPRYIRTIKQVHVHHTASGNDYRRGDVPALIRGMYRYHTRYLGWSDIGYNFLVDRFGRIWTGRAGGSGRLVRGAHTLGFNATSAGVAVIGNFDLVRPSDEVLDAVAAVAAWKLRPFDRDPLGNVRVRSEGSDRFRRGRKVRLPTVDGHRDTNQTACPGKHLYRRLPEIRERTQAVVRRYSKVRLVTPPSLSGKPVLGSTLTVDPGSYSPSGAALSYVWLRDGKPIPRASGREYVVRPADVGTRLSVRITARHSDLKALTRRRWSSRRASGPSSVSVSALVLDGRRLRVAVRVDSPRGVRPVATGKVVVRLGERRAVVRLSDGHGVATFGATRPLPRGRYRVRARYEGDRFHGKSRAGRKVRV